MKLRISLLMHPTEVKGRLHPVVNNFRCDWHLWFNRETLNCGNVTCDGPFDHTSGPVEVTLEPMVPDLWKDVTVGQQLFMHEGPRQIGVAVVKEIYES